MLALAPALRRPTTAAKENQVPLADAALAVAARSSPQAASGG
jgi:hypothetical protein